jgi:hypothetical protein
VLNTVPLNRKGEKRPREAIGHAAEIRVVYQGAIDVLFGFVPSASANEQSFLLPYLLGARQCFQCGGDIGVGTCGGSYVQGAEDGASFGISGGKGACGDGNGF